jgi:hypothetical protein
VNNVAAILRRQKRARSIDFAAERGFIAVSTAIVMVLLLMCAALALDVAIWYARSAQLQRQADAAALAGVTRMPDFASAQSAATKIATQNRSSTGQVTVGTIPNSPRQIKVTVTDPAVRSFFGSLVKQSIGMTRSSIAEYVPKIEMGSRLNAIGTGSIPGWTPSGGTQNFWLAINGSCTAREDGDQYASKFDGTRDAAGVATCGGPSAVDNLSFRSEGSSSGHGQPSYSYIVDIPCAVPGQDPCVTDFAAPSSYVNIDAYNPIFDMSNDISTIDTNVIDPAIDLAQFNAAAVSTTFQLRTIDGSPTAYPLAQYDSCFQCAATNGWITMWTVQRGGRYRIDVSSLDSVYAFGSNAFALRAWATGAGPVLCDAPGCPSIAGQASLSVYANVSGGQADFYLAKLAPARYYRGKKVQVLLFDPGEGAQSIQLLAPTPDPLNPYAPIGFSYRTWTPNLAGYPDDPGFPPANVVGPGFALDVSTLGSTLAPAQKAPWWGAHPPANDYEFNGRMVSIELQIPPTYGCVANTIPCVEATPPQDGWWKIRYNTTASDVSDRTTWTVQLIGDPVHLVHNA